MADVTIMDVPAEELRFHRLSGRVSLDLVATIGERWNRRFERLREPADLDRWLAAVGITTTAGAGATDLARARELRGAVEALAVAQMSGRSLPTDATVTLNRFAAHPDPAPQLTGGGVQAPATSVASALSAVARDGVQLFGSANARRVRECAAPDCALVFVDASRGARRRWCSMQGCGNRSKVARHRRGQLPNERKESQ